PASIITGINDRSGAGPHVVILDTVKGRGTCFEGQMESHYLPLSHEQYMDAFARLTDEENAK
ncbi:MAG: hypothetical protein LUD38_03410, partial [Parabacteroides sp.]|nr:hypothetical protein [Parabacteroides sp.]